MAEHDFRCQRASGSSTPRSSGCGRPGPRPTDLRAWWGPTGFTCPRAEADIRPGGRIFVTMRAPAEWGGVELSQQVGHHRGRAAAAAELRHADSRMPPARRSPPAEAGIPADGVPERGEHEVLLTALEDGRTRLEMVEHGYTTEEARDMSQGGLEQCLDKMARARGVACELTSARRSAARGSRVSEPLGTLAA